MLRLAGRAGGMGWGAAWAAAYALVFQLVFASALMAAMPRDASGTPVCTASASLSVDPQSGGGADRTALHCLACLARADIADLPPPIPVPAIERTAAVVVAALPARPIAPRAAARLPSQPRAPPFLG